MRVRSNCGQVRNGVKHLELRDRLLAKFPMRLLESWQSLSSLDVSYNLLDEIPSAVKCLCNLRCLLLTCNRLASLPDEIADLRHLRLLDVSRNFLCKLPPVLDKLTCLRKLNLSGNRLSAVPADVLEIRSLRRLFVTRNCLQDFPRDVYLAGLQAMRRYVGIDIPVPGPDTDSDDDLESTSGKSRCRGVLEPAKSARPSSDWSRRARGVFSQSSLSLSDASVCDSDYATQLDDCGEPAGESGGEADNSEVDSSEVETVTSRRRCVRRRVQKQSSANLLEDLYERPSGINFSRFSAPLYYTILRAHDVLVAVPVFSPRSIGRYRVSTSLDPRLKPKLSANEVLVSPVVVVQPHGARFSSSWRAYLRICHCAVIERSQYLKVICSDTDTYERTSWEALPAEIHPGKESILVEVEHFSLFAVVLVEPYPRSDVVLQENEDQHVTVASIPNVTVYFPSGCVNMNTAVCLKVLYADYPYHCDNEVHPLASPVLCATPHGLHFQPGYAITIQLPVPQGRRVFQEVGACGISLLWSDTEHGEPLCWKVFEGALDITEVGDNDHLTVSFRTTHFSFFKTVFRCASVLWEARLGASYFYQEVLSKQINITCQILMSDMDGQYGADNSFGLQVLCYKFGSQLSSVGNYPLQVGYSHRQTLYTGLVNLSFVSAYFRPNDHTGQASMRVSARFDGNDFSVPFSGTIHQQLPRCGPFGSVVFEKHFMQSKPHQLFEITLIMPKSSPRTSAPQSAALSNSSCLLTPTSPASDLRHGSPFQDFSEIFTEGSSFSERSHNQSHRKRRSESCDGADWTAPAKRACSHRLSQNSISMRRFGEPDEPVTLSPSVWQDLATVSAREWRPMARHLGLSDSSIDSIESTHHDDAERCYQMFRAWREKRGQHAVWSDLLYALEKVDRITALCHLLGRHCVTKQLCFDEHRKSGM